ncbi:MAG: hypothetical protein FJ255_04935 [Phycisphaerae bacterium]|nr:hypothetical protein [Phycisphaerae bacterium]
MSELISDTLAALRGDPKKKIIALVAIVALGTGVVLIARSLFGDGRAGPVSPETGAPIADPGPENNPNYDKEMDPKRGQRQGNRYLAPSGQ